MGADNGLSLRAVEDGQVAVVLESGLSRPEGGAVRALGVYSCYDEALKHARTHHDNPDSEQYQLTENGLVVEPAGLFRRRPVAYVNGHVKVARDGVRGCLHDYPSDLGRPCWSVTEYSGLSRRYREIVAGLAYAEAVTVANEYLLAQPLREEPAVVRGPTRFVESCQCGSQSGGAGLDPVPLVALADLYRGHWERHAPMLAACGMATGADPAIRAQQELVGSFSPAEIVSMGDPRQGELARLIEGDASSDAALDAILHRVAEAMGPAFTLRFVPAVLPKETRDMLRKQILTLVKWKRSIRAAAFRRR